MLKEIRAPIQDTNRKFKQNLVGPYIIKHIYSRGEVNPYALWGYRTSVRSPTRAIPYSLVYGMEAVLPIEMGVCSLRIVLESEIPEVDWLQSKYDQLCMMDKKRLEALYHIQGYQRRLRKNFD